MTPNIKHWGRILPYGQSELTNRFEFYWELDRQGKPSVKRRTATKKFLTRKQRIREWIKTYRHPGLFITYSLRIGPSLLTNPPSPYPPA